MFEVNSQQILEWCGTPPPDEGTEYVACANYQIQPGTFSLMQKVQIPFGPTWLQVMSDEWKVNTSAHEFGHAVGLNDFEGTECEPQPDTGSPTIMGHDLYPEWMSRPPCAQAPYMMDVLQVACGTYSYDLCGYAGSGGCCFSVLGSFPDADSDDVPDPDDNCPGNWNWLQQDRDSDGLGDTCDLDDDGDVFSDARETYLGTVLLDDCRDAPSHDAWPLDLNIDGRATTIDIGQYAPRMNATPGHPMWSQRHDLVPDQILNTVDIGMFVPSLNHDCLTALDSQLLDTAEAVEPYGNSVQAEAQGFAWMTAEVPGFGLWMLKKENLGGFDKTQPQGLIYSKDSSGFPRLAGVFWLFPEWNDLIPPDAFAGTTDIWRTHQNFCIDSDYVPAENVAKSACDGVHWDVMGHVLFAWIRELNPNGTFTEYNPAE
jgi:hypothetical protein